MSTPKLIRPQNSADSNTEGWVYHLSHTDLDGYGAQFMLKAAGVKTRCFNADYRDIPLAVDQLEQALRHPDLSRYDQERIQARLEEFRQILAERLKK